MNWPTAFVMGVFIVCITILIIAGLAILSGKKDTK